MTINERLKWILSGVVCVAIGGFLLWAHLGDAGDGCRQEAMGYQAVLQAEKALYEENLGKWELRSMHDLAARKVAEQELKKTQAELGVALAARHRWTTATGESVLDPPGLTHMQQLERMVTRLSQKAVMGLAKLKVGP